MSESLSRSRRLIQEYILCNRFALFCTFTFDEKKVADRKDYKEIKARLCKAFNNFRNRYDPTFLYLIVPELHKDGSVHFHGVMTVPVGLCSPLKIPKKDKYGVNRMVPNMPGYMDWPYYSSRFGYFSCSWIRNYTGCAVYVSKYLTKSLAEWFSKHDQIVMHSKGLNRPELVYKDAGNKIPGERQKSDYEGDFCAVGMRDVQDTAQHYIHWVDKFSIRPFEVIAPEDWWKHEEWGKMPGPVDGWEQIKME